MQVAPWRVCSISCTPEWLSQGEAAAEFDCDMRMEILHESILLKPAAHDLCRLSHYFAF